MLLFPGKLQHDFPKSYVAWLWESGLKESLILIKTLTSLGEP